ncbi:type I secretion membrane fusion protein, HlyD family [Tolumonas auensis DSM 9187]|uniref:Membrane fusion protein (MFP) family protein n=1 Tax=Tolumonas auensis (strain DSM 9187 / NBRC 110442 / TA 4) TaxID=595494 RepID=C4LE56_TOLAT|nr:HlyD family type I secretion periplasmic adaptor subunit [Tolumonas auensis]ACQ92877.1 type I secretion membrane fusion protein, HlyD family [Tolumonas auensis DSM 9187]
MSNSELNQKQLDLLDDASAAVLLTTPIRAKLLLWSCFLFFIVAFIWAAWAELDEVTRGDGKVIPSKQLQVIQNLEGGIVKEIFAREGQMVEEGQELLRIDDTRFRSDFGEKQQELISVQGDVARLRAEIASISVSNDTSLPWREQAVINEQPIIFPEGYEAISPENVARQKNALQANINNLNNQLVIMGQQIEQKENEILEINSKIRTLGRSVGLAGREVAINRPLVKEGIVSQIDLLKMQRQLNDMQGELENARLLLPKQNSLLRESILKRKDVALQFRVDAQKEMEEKQSRLSQLNEGQIGLKDRVSRTSVTSPVKGTIKTLKVNTVGGVVQPGMDIVEIVPTEDTLLIEAKVLPKDIAFLRPGLKAMVKFTAYDFTIYGGLDGKLEHISADSIQDDKGNSFYLVRVRTDRSFLGSDAEPLPIIPGMMATVDIVTGKKSVLEYLMKPILRAKQSALRER